MEPFGSRWFYTLEQYLEEEARSSREVRKLVEMYHTVRDEMHRSLKAVLSFFPHYSEHDEDHSRHIISAVERLLGEERIRELSPADAWAILVSAYMHDAGMIVRDKELQRDWVSEPFQAFLKRSGESADSDIREAARFFLDGKKPFTPGWPVFVKKYVIMLAAEFYRTRHAQRSGETQAEPLHSLLSLDIYGGGKLPPRIQEVIADITVSHGGSMEELLERLKEKDSLLGMPLHPRLVAVLLRIGDLCDMDNERFNLPLCQTFGDMGRNNAAHYWKHQSIRSFSIEKDFVSVLSDIRFGDIKAQLPAGTEKEEGEEICNKTVLETKRWFSWLEAEFVNMKLHWRELAPDVLPMSPDLSYEIRVNGEKSITSEKNMRFVFSNEKAYTLLEGYSLYDDQLVFVRELIQNSLDALKMQMWRDVRAGRWDHLLTRYREKEGNRTADGSIDYRQLQPFDFSDNSIYEFYRIQTDVRHHEDEKKAVFTITDNGTGISGEDLENRILHTGSSWRQGRSEAEVEEMPGWLRPTGSFGIGLHSVFALADSIEIRTRTEADGRQYNISLHSGKQDGYVFLNAEQDPEEWVSFCGSAGRGTRLRVKLDLEKYRGETENGKKDPQKEDPFAPRPGSNFCADIQEKIKSRFLSPLFRIRYRFYEAGGDQATYTGQTGILCDSGIFSRKRRNCLWEKPFHHEERYDYAFYDWGTAVEIWDRKEGLFLQFSFIRRGLQFCCKGALVPDTEIRESYPWPHVIYMDLLKGDSGHILTVARSSLKREQYERLAGILEEAGRFLARLYRETAEELCRDEEIKAFEKALRDAVSFEITDDMGRKEAARQYRIRLERVLGAFFREDYRDAMKIPCLLQMEKELLFYQRESSINRMHNEGKKRNGKTEPDDLEIYKSVLSLLNDVSLQAWVHFLSGEVQEVKFAGEFVRYFIREYRSYLYSIFGADNRFSITHIGTSFVNYSLRKFSIAFEKEFFKKLSSSFINGFIGDYTREFGSDYGGAFAGYFFQYLDHKMEAENPGDKENKYGYFLLFPFAQVVYRVFLTIEATPDFLEAVRTELEKEPGFLYGYECMSHKKECQTVLEVLTCGRTEIKEACFKWFSEQLPVFHYIPCSRIMKNKTGELVLEFDRERLEQRCIGLEEEEAVSVLSAYQETHDNTKLLPAFQTYEAISINQGRDFEEFSQSYPDCCTKNYYMPLWRRFKKMKEYANRLPEGREALIGEIMEGLDGEQRGVPNLLYYIYRHSARKEYYREIGYERAMGEIAACYERLVGDVLDCVELVYGKKEPESSR